MDMNMIRPVSDLRNNFADISKTVHETAQPVFLTKNGYGDMVVMSMEAFEKMQFESDASDRLTYDGTWENNLFNFIRTVLPKLTSDLPRPFNMEGVVRNDDTYIREKSDENGLESMNVNMN